MPAQRWLPRSYLLVAAAAWLVLLWHLTRREVGGDWYFHLAGVAELGRSLWNPSHPFLPTAAPEVTFTPYAVALAALGRITGAGPVALLAWVAPVNVGLLFVAFGRFAWRATARALTPAVALVVMLLVWGSEPWVWSGHLDVGSLGATAAYPSTIAIAVLFAALALVLGLPSTADAAGVGLPWWRPLAVPLVALTAATWFALLTHPFTGAWLVGLVVVAVAVRPLTWRTRAAAVAALGLGAGLALLWPWYPLGELVTANGDFDASQELLAQGFAGRNWPYAVAVVLAVVRVVRNRRDPLAALALSATAVLAVGLVSSRTVFVRIDGVAFALLAVVAADETLRAVASLRTRLGSRTWWVPALASLVALIIVGSSVAANERFRNVLTPPPLRAADEPSRHVNGFGQFAFARGRPAGEVLMIPYPLVIGAAAFTDGAKQQSTPWVAHFEPTEASRRDDARRFWDPGTSMDDRVAILDRWQVTGVLVPPGDALAATLGGRGWRVDWRGPEGELWVRPG